MRVLVVGATGAIGKLLAGPEHLAPMAPSCLGDTAKDSTTTSTFG
jgi:hypothetical protein